MEQKWYIQISKYIYICRFAVYQLQTQLNNFVSKFLQRKPQFILGHVNILCGNIAYFTLSDSGLHDESWNKRSIERDESWSSLQT